MSDKRESFLRRWSRLKHQSEEQPQPGTAKQDDEPPPLPPIEELDFDSDFSAFMHPKVDLDLRRAALKKLFTSERFKSMDGLDVYVGDYSNPEPLAAGVAATLRHAATLLEQPDRKSGAEAAPGDEDQKPEESSESTPVASGESPAAKEGSGSA